VLEVKSAGSSTVFIGGRPRATRVVSFEARKCLSVVTLHRIDEALRCPKLAAKFQTQGGLEDAGLLFDDQLLHRGTLELRLNVR
jgi:hypothetical protein